MYIYIYVWDLIECPVQICMDHILAVLHIPAERAGGFIALGEMAGALDGKLIDYLPTITTHLRDAVYSLINSRLLDYFSFPIFLSCKCFFVCTYYDFQIAPRRGKPSLEAMACVGSFAKAMGLDMEPYVRDLLDSMFLSGLSPTLIESLEQITARFVLISIFCIFYILSV